MLRKHRYCDSLKRIENNLQKFIASAFNHQSGTLSGPKLIASIGLDPINSLYNCTIAPTNRTSFMAIKRITAIYGHHVYCLK